jgi:DNA adenine methylase
LGGGALFFGLFRDVRPAMLADTNPRLINAYMAVRDQLPTLIDALARYQERFDQCKTWGEFRALYMVVRSQEPQEQWTVVATRAAWLITMNRTCMNGLYRENKSGGFNVGPGKWGKENAPFRMPRIYDPLNLLACSAALQGVKLVCFDFDRIISTARAGELLYIDPPYCPTSDTANFTSYTKSGFGLEAHQRLVDVAKEAVRRGVKVAISNSDTAQSRSLYGSWTIHDLEARRNINSVGSKRGPVGEILVTTFDAKK